MNQNMIPDNKLDKAISVTYNIWFKKWSHMSGKMNDDLWMQCIDEANRILINGKYKALNGIVLALLHELEAREVGGYQKLP